MPTLAQELQEQLDQATDHLAELLLEKGKQAQALTDAETG